MEKRILTKSQAAQLFGGRLVDLARAVGLHKSAISDWPEELKLAQSDRVIGAAYRLGKLDFRTDSVLVQGLTSPALNDGSGASGAESSLSSGSQDRAEA